VQVRLLVGARGLLPRARTSDPHDSSTRRRLRLGSRRCDARGGGDGGRGAEPGLSSRRAALVPRRALGSTCRSSHRAGVLAFQWDNLLLESAFFALFVSRAGSARGASAHPLGVFLMLWLVFRLHVESGVAKPCSATRGAT
jgi:hypothetical protein